MTEMFVTVTGERDIALRFERLPDAIRKRLRRTIEDLAGQLAARQRAAAPRLSGRLSSEVGNVIIDEGPDFVRGRVTVRAANSIDAAKAGALEYGAPGKRGRFVVREHKRRGHGVGMETIVDRYMRTANLIEQRYLRGPFEAMRGQIETELAAAIDDSVREVERV